MSRWMAWLLLWSICIGLLAIAFWQGRAGDWPTASIFAFLAGNANAFALAIKMEWP